MNKKEEKMTVSFKLKDGVSEEQEQEIWNEFLDILLGVELAPEKEKCLHGRGGELSESVVVECAHNDDGH